MSAEMRRIMTLIETVEIDEMPIKNITHIGNFDKPTMGFKKPEDRVLVTNPKAIQKIHKKFANNKYDFNFFFVNTPEGARHREVGRIDAQWLQENMPKAAPVILKNFDENAVNCVFTGNAAAERYPMTAWIVAHRLGHALSPGLQRNDSTNMLRAVEKNIREYAESILNVYDVNFGGTKHVPHSELALRHFFEQIGTFKSARDKNIREHFEFTFECLAQFLTTGTIKFNHLQRCIQIRTVAWDPPERRCCSVNDLVHINNTIDDMANAVMNDLEDSLDAATGKLFLI